MEKASTMNRALCAVLTVMLMLALVPTYAFAAGDEAESDFDIEAAMKSKTTEDFYNWLAEQQNSGLCPMCGEPSSNECFPYVLAGLEENIDDSSYWYSHEWGAAYAPCGALIYESIGSDIMWFELDYPEAPFFNGL